MNSDEMNALAMGWDSSERTRQKSYRVERGIAVLPVMSTPRFLTVICHFHAR
ncbi:hypothetical protein [Escherichia coli]|uniref:hypothetical protein n=1 Tax=Escherichia coli TaxID=562 RepID=UPI003D6EDCDA